MKNWFKKVEFEEYDILIVRDSNHEDGENVKVTVCFNNVKVSATLIYEDDEAKADKSYLEYGEKQAKELIGGFKDMFTETLKSE